MNDFLLYNDRFYKSETSLVGASNRGLRYGDGLFETLRYCDGKVQLADWHMERLFDGLKLLWFDLPAYFTPGYLAGQIMKLAKKNQHTSARVRITVFRGNGGPYDPQDHFPHCIIQTWSLPGNGFELNENGLVAGIYRNAKKSMDSFSNLKTNNYLPYLMAALQAKKERWDDAFVLNTAERICDATIANIFVVKNGTICTCPLQEGCIAGIMRRFLLERLPVNNFSIQEKTISEEDLLVADEVFLTNAIKGIRWVGQCGAARYSNQITKAVFSKLFKK